MIHHIDQQEAAWLESDFEICRNFANVMHLWRSAQYMQKKNRNQGHK